MKYNVGDVFESINPSYKANFKSYTIIDRDLNRLTYKIRYQDSSYVDIIFPERILDDDVRLGEVSYIPFYKVIRSGAVEFNTSVEITPRKGYVAIDENICHHPNKYLNKVFTMQFYVCPDCKKEV